LKYRKFGDSSLTVSEVGFGAWAIGGGAMIGETAIGWGKTNDDESVKAIHAALDAGINFFDTADIYGLGHSEELLGKTLQKNRDVIIASKAGNVARNDQFTVDYSREHIIRACEASLRRLKRNEIDLYQLHSARLAQLQEGECIEAMKQLQQQGKIRYWGLSLNTFEPEPEAKFLIENNNGNSLQLVLNILNQTALPVLKPAAEKGMGIIARMPLQFGLLTGKFDATSSFDQNDHRRNRLTPGLITACLEALKPVWELCRKYECSKTTLALSYVLSYEEVSVTIPGIRTVKHVKENTTEIFKLDENDRSMIEGMFRDEWKDLWSLIRKQG
jgi:aryl-alcohol dehydrogenase-like predicted oxidoreductase